MWIKLLDEILDNLREDARGGADGAHAPPKFHIIITTFTTAERSLSFKIGRIIMKT